MDEQMKHIQDDLNQFYKDNLITHTVDGIGNEVWSYEGITIASYDDFISSYGDDEPTSVFCHWFVDKRNPYLHIAPVKKHGKFYFLPHNNFGSCPWADFKNYYSEPDRFKQALLSAITLLKPRIQILKGKITMVKKTRWSKYTTEQCMQLIESSMLTRVFRNIHDSYYIKLQNGKVCPCLRLSETHYCIQDGDTVYIIKYGVSNGNKEYYSWNLSTDMISHIEQFVKVNRINT